MTFGADIFFFMFSVVSILEWFIGQFLAIFSLSGSRIKIKKIWRQNKLFISPALANYNGRYGKL